MDIPRRKSKLIFYSQIDLKPLFQTVLKILNKPNSLMDWGTYASNAIVSGNKNGLLNVMDNYDKVKEFFAINLDAFITSAALEYFGMENVNSTPTMNSFEPSLKWANQTEKRQWLHKHAGHMIDKFVMDGVTDLNSIREEFSAPAPPKVEHPCRHPGCNRKFFYMKCLLKHELNVHGLDLPNPANGPEKQSEHRDHTEEKIKSDGIYDYGCLTLSLGLLLRDADDAVREGDGERLSRVWKFLTFLYRAGGNNKYALAGLRLTASHLALLSPRQSHRLKWNRFAARESGTGRRLSRDLLLENNNLIGKEEIKALGFPNINNQNIISATRSIGPIQELLQKSNKDLGLSKRKTHHANKTRQDVFNRVLHQVHQKAAVFKYSPGRKYNSFPNVQPIFTTIDRKQLHAWIKRNKSKWHRQNRHLYSK